MKNKIWLIVFVALIVVSAIVMLFDKGATSKNATSSNVMPSASSSASSAAKSSSVIVDGTAPTSSTGTLASNVVNTASQDMATVSQSKLILLGIQLNTVGRQINVGEKFTLTYTLKPDGISGIKVTYSSSDNTIAIVNANTGEVTALKAGQVNITAKADNSNVSSLCFLLVNAKTGTTPYNENP